MRWTVFIIAAAALSQPLKWAPVQPGEFTMGCDPGYPCAESLPKKKVRIDRGFSIARTEVTVRQFAEFARAAGYRTDAEKAGDAKTWRSPGFGLKDRQPVVFMSLNDANAFCEWAGGRVPSEAEWEYAARAGAATHHYWGEEMDDRYLWYFGNTDGRPEPVGRKLPNAWGLFDVEGNAWEWTRGAPPHTSVTREGWGTIRGGSWITCPEPYGPENGRRQRQMGLSVVFEGFKNSNFRPDFRRYDTGIRCAK